MKTMKTMKTNTTLATIFGLVALASATHGAVIINSYTYVAPPGIAETPHDPSTSGAPNLFSASSTDLVQGRIATVTSTGGGTPSTTLEASAGEGAWTNGSISTVYNTSSGFDSNHGAYGTVQGFTSVTFNLGALYDLSLVNVFLGWNDSGRDDASFNLRVSTDGIDYSTIASYTKGDDNTGTYTTPVTNLHSIVDSGAAPIASGVQYVQLQFTAADNGFAGMLEVDVIGTAVPEPSAALLGGLGMLALLRRRR